MEENADIQSDVASVGVAVEVRPGLFVVDPLLRAAVPEVEPSSIEKVVMAPKTFFFRWMLT